VIEAVRPVANGLAETVRWLVAAPRYYDPRRPDRPRRTLRLPVPEVYEVRTDDGVALRLTRYRPVGGSGAPVMLSHCIGVSSRMYLSDTQPTTLTEYLHERGYDVWLLDHRLSIELTASQQASAMDDVALRDYPAAIAAVREATGADGVHVVAHGVGSSTFTMALLAGLEGVRSAVCSQVSTHLRVPILNRLKTESRSSTLMARLGQSTMTTYTDATSSLPARAIDRAVRLYPIAIDERCLNPVCHRITAVFGELYEHAQVGHATHEVLHELFGVANLRALQQLERIIRRGHLVDEHGAEAYLPHVERLALRLTLIHGAANECVLPRATELTFDLLTRSNDPALYQRHLIPGYGHVDCMLGEHADRDVFPHILAHLERAA